MHLLKMWKFCIAMCMVLYVAAGIEIDVIGSTARKAVIGDAPWIVSFQMEKTDFAFCSGTLISSNCNRTKTTAEFNDNEEPTTAKPVTEVTISCTGWVSTAATCMENYLPINTTDIIATLGNLNLNKTDHGGIPLTMGKHQTEFNRETYENDIALIPVNFTFTRDFPTKDENYDYPTLKYKTDSIFNESRYDIITTTFAGWGLGAQSGSMNIDLYNTSLTLNPSRQCSDVYKQKFDLSSMLCVGSKGNGPCSYDVGGPLACEYDNNGNKEKYLCGIASMGKGCGDTVKYYPAIFTNVTFHADWIDSIVN